jgi:AraC-like DNA-binding protein
MLDLTAGMAGEMFVSRARFSAMMAERSRPHLIHGDTDYYVLQLFMSGTEKLFAHDRRFVLGTEVVCLRDWRYACTGISEDSDDIGYAIPRHLVHSYGLMNARQPVLLWSRSTPAGEWLAGALLRVWRLLPGSTIHEAAELASGLIGLLNGLLANRDKDGNERRRCNRAMKLTIQEHIKSNLSGSDLSIEALCSTYHISRASLYRLFQEDGGIQSYIREQKLINCLSSLRAADVRSIKVRDIAERWGFTSASHFNRLFKGEFGLTPSDVLMQDQAPFSKSDYPSLPGDSNDISAIKQWLCG